VQVFYCSRLCGCRILTFYKNLHSILQFALHFLFLCITLLFKKTLFAHVICSMSFVEGATVKKICAQNSGGVVVEI